MRSNRAWAAVATGAAALAVAAPASAFTTGVTGTSATLTVAPTELTGFALGSPVSFAYVEADRVALTCTKAKGATAGTTKEFRRWERMLWTATVTPGTANPVVVTMAAPVASTQARCPAAWRAVANPPERVIAEGATAWATQGSVTLLLSTAGTPGVPMVSPEWLDELHEMHDDD